MAGTQEIKDVIKVGADAAKLGIQIGKDKAVGLQDLPLAFKLIQDLPALIDKIDQVPAELADLDSAEGVDLVGYCMSELALEESAAKDLVAACLATAATLPALVAAARKVAAPKPVVAPAV